MVERAAPKKRAAEPEPEARERPRRPREDEDKSVARVIGGLPNAEPPTDRLNLREFEDHLRFDRDALDDALMGQPDLFYRVSSAYAMAISDRDGLKLELEQAQAELDKQIRQKADEDEAKITEKAILSEIEMAPKITRMKKALGEASLRVAKWGALKEAYQQRSYAIKDMCGLYVANYFSTQAGTGARNDAVDRRAGDIRQGAGELRRSRRDQE